VLHFTLISPFLPSLLPIISPFHSVSFYSFRILFIFFYSCLVLFRACSFHLFISFVALITYFFNFSYSHYLLSLYLFFPSVISTSVLHFTLISPFLPSLLLVISLLSFGHLFLPLSVGLPLFLYPSSHATSPADSLDSRGPQTPRARRQPLNCTHDKCIALFAQYWLSHKRWHMPRLSRCVQVAQLQPEPSRELSWAATPFTFSLSLFLEPFEQLKCRDDRSGVGRSAQNAPQSWGGIAMGYTRRLRVRYLQRQEIFSTTSWPAVPSHLSSEYGEIWMHVIA
jgi:hypothetical protein